MSDLYSYNDWRDYEALKHHGILGQKWYVKNGPPYPLDAEDHNASEKKAGWKNSLDDAIDSIRDRSEVRRAVSKLKLNSLGNTINNDPNMPNAKKVVKSHMSKDQLKRLDRAYSRIGEAMAADDAARDPKIERERDSWIRKNAEAAVADERRRNPGEFETYSRIDTLTDGYMDYFSQEWDNAHPEYASSVNSYEAAVKQRTADVNQISRELLGKGATKRDLTRMEDVLSEIQRDKERSRWH